MAIKINDFTMNEYTDFEVYRRTGDGELDFRLTDLQNLTLNATQDKTELKGKNGRIIGYKKQNKALSGEGTSGVISAGLMAVQTGGETVQGKHIIKKSEVRTVSGDTVVTSAAAVGTAGSEIGIIRVLNDVGAVDVTYLQATTADATHFSYDPTSKKITLPVNASDPVIANGKTIEYAYNREVEGAKITDPSDKYSQVREIWIHGFGTDACDNEYYAAIYIPRADFSGEFSLELGGDQTVHDFKFDAMADLCAKNGSSNLFELIIYSDGTQPNP